jgi:hypothetical protein
MVHKMHPTTAILIICQSDNLCSFYNFIHPPITRKDHAKATALAHAAVDTQHRSVFLRSLFDDRKTQSGWYKYLQFQISPEQTNRGRSKRCPSLVIANI